MEAVERVGGRENDKISVRFLLTRPFRNCREMPINGQHPGTASSFPFWPIASPLMAVSWVETSTRSKKTGGSCRQSPKPPWCLRPCGPKREAPFNPKERSRDCLEVTQSIFHPLGIQWDGLDIPCLSTGRRAFALAQLL